MAAKNAGGRFASGLGFGVAVGLVLGALVIAPNTPGLGGAAGGSAEAGAHGDVRAEYQKLLQDNKQQEAQLKAGDELIAHSQEGELKGALKDRPVTVIRTDDAKDFDTNAVHANLDKAGAINAGEIKLTRKFYDRNSADKLNSIITNTLPAGAELSEDSLEAGAHGGEAIGFAIGMDPKTGEPLASVKERAELLQTLRDAGFIDYKDKTILPAQAVVLITDDDVENGYYTSTLAGFARGIDDAIGHTVVAARAQSTHDGGVLAALREKDGDITTIDSLDRGWARLAVPLAVSEQLNGKDGAYGAAKSAEAPMPDSEKEGK